MPPAGRRSLFRSAWFYMALLAVGFVGYKVWSLLRPASGDAGVVETYVSETPGQSDSDVALPSDPARAIKQLGQWAKKAVAEIPNRIRDYSAVMIKRERNGNVLGPAQCMFVKVRHKPFSVYLHFLAPDSSKGDEAIYVEGKNDGNLLGHTTGMTGKLVGTLALSPTGMIAMRGQRHPIMNTGILYLTERLLEAAEKFADSKITYVNTLPQAKINGRPCTCIEVVLPQLTAGASGKALARIFIDKALGVPVRYEQYDWSGNPGDEPQLMEQYTYIDVKVNNGFTDADFDKHNPGYAFP